MAKRKSLLLILLSAWVVFCLIWFFTIYQKDQKKTLAEVKPVTEQLPVTQVALPDTGSTNTKEIADTSSFAGSNSPSKNTAPLMVANAAMDEPVAAPADTVVSSARKEVIPHTETFIKNEIALNKKTESGANKKLSVCYFYNNSNNKLKNFSPRISKKIRAYLTSVSTKIIITGHTDYVGSVAYNYQLGLQRAERVKQILIKKGIAAERIEVLSMGEEKPVANNKSLKGRAKNRRVEINITLS
jgi:outer membrane protein OmpA-like peptidoglycan-associated protein